MKSAYQIQLDQERRMQRAREVLAEQRRQTLGSHPVSRKRVQAREDEIKAWQERRDREREAAKARAETQRIAVKGLRHIPLEEALGEY